MARSNPIPFDVIQVPPLQEVGWEVRVLNYLDFETRQAEGGDGRPLAVINRFVDLTISPEIGGTGLGSGGLGAGSVTLDMDDPFWATTLPDGNPATSLLEFCHLWQVWDHGVVRFEFLAETISQTFLTETQTRAVVVSGHSTAAVLGWGVVLPPQYPKAYPLTAIESEFVFNRVPRMSAWLQVLATVVRRGTIGFVTPTFTHTFDSAGEPWEDTAETPAPTSVTSVLSADVNFASDSYTLTSAAHTTLQGIVAQFNTLPAPQITCVGHTDSTNTISYNQTLSVNRANAVKNYIKSLYPAAIVTTSGKGELQPVATNATSSGRAKNRRVTITYPSTTANPPADTPYGPTLGMSMLDLLKEWTGENRDQWNPVRLEWMMRPNFRLDVRRQFGTRRDKQVVFFEGSTHLATKSCDRNREAIANLIIVQSDEGDYSVATNADSVTRWRQREVYDSQPNATDTTARSVVAQSKLEQVQTERSTWTIKVPPYTPGRRIFVDYDLGDWIGISRLRASAANTVDRFRVMAATLRVSNTNTVDLELTLQNTTDAYNQRLAARITSLLYHQETGTRTWISDAEPIIARPGDFWTPRTPGTG